MMKRRTMAIGIVCWGLLGLLLLPSGAGAASVGTTAASFLRMSVGARAEALGEMGAVGVDGIESLYWNPAGLAGAVPGHVWVSHQQLWQDVSAMAFAVGVPGWRLGSAAVGIQRVGVSSWNNLAEGSGIDAGDLAVLLGIARSLSSRTDVGFSARMLSSSIGEHSASGLSVDCGLRYRVSDRFMMAGAIRNMGSGLSYTDGNKDPLPLVGVFGGAYGWKPLALFGEVRKERGIDAFGSLGAEVRVHPALALRLGSRIGSGPERASSDVTWGAGVGLTEVLSFDYSYRDSDLGASHQFSGMFLFGGSGDIATTRRLKGREIPSNLVVVQNLAGSGLDSLLAVMPDVDGGVIAIQWWGGESGSGVRAKDADEAGGEQLLEDLLTERLTRAGLAVQTGETTAPATEDSLSESRGMVSSPVLEYRVLEMRVDYPSGRRRHYIGRKEVERVVRVHVRLRLLDGMGGAVVWAGAAERVYRDIVPHSLLSSLASESFSFTRAEAQDQKWDKFLEPVVATAIVGGLVYLFYSNKSSE